MIHSVRNTIAADGSLSSINIQIGMQLKTIEKMVILETLRHQRYNRTKTASVLGIGVRTLQRKLKQYSMDAASSCG